MTQRPEPRYFDVTVKEIIDFGNDTRHYELTFSAGETMGFLAGQFVAVLCPKENQVVRRAYSVASAPQTKDHLDLLVKRVEGGVVTGWFWTLKPGDRLRIQGPFGKFVLPNEIDFDPVFVAVGAGVAPFRSMIQHLLSRGFQRKIRLLFGTRYEEAIPYQGEWLECARRVPHFTYIPTISRPTEKWKGRIGYVQTHIGRFFSNPEGRRIYICGLNEMIREVEKEALRVGYRKGQIFSERYD